MKSFSPKEINLIKKKARTAGEKFSARGILADDLEQEVWVYLLQDRIYKKIEEYRGQPTTDDNYFSYPNGGFKKFNTVVDRCIYNHINKIIDPERIKPLYTLEQLSNILPYIFESTEIYQAGGQVHDMIIVVRNGFYQLNWKDRKILEGKYRDGLSNAKLKTLIPQLANVALKDIPRKIENCLIHLQNYIEGDNLKVEWDEKSDNEMLAFNSMEQGVDYE